MTVVSALTDLVKEKLCKRCARAALKRPIEEPEQPKKKLPKNVKGAETEGVKVAELGWWRTRVERRSLM